MTSIKGLYRGFWVRLPAQEALKKASTFLAKAARRHKILRVQPRVAKRAVIAALEAIAREAGIEGGLVELRRVTYKGFHSRHLFLISGGDDDNLIVSSLGPSGIATAALYKYSPSLFLFNVFDFNTLGGFPVSVLKVLSRSSWADSRRLVYCRVKDVAAFQSHYEIVAVKVLLESLESLQAASEGVECDAASVLRSLGWRVRDKGGRLEAYRIIEGDEIAVAVDSETYNSISASFLEKQYDGVMEACGKVVRLTLKAHAAHLLPQTGRCWGIGKRATVRLGAVRVEAESQSLAMACYSDDIKYINIFNNRKSFYIPINCYEGNRGVGVNVLVEGPARIRASLGSLVEEIELPQGLLFYMVLEPLPARVAAVAAPSGEVEVIPGDRLRGVEILDPGYEQDEQGSSR